jgi:hypothetical protein
LISGRNPGSRPGLVSVAPPALEGDPGCVQQGGACLLWGCQSARCVRFATPQDIPPRIRRSSAPAFRGRWWAALSGLRFGLCGHDRRALPWAGLGCPFGAVGAGLPRVGAFSPESAVGTTDFADSADKQELGFAWPHPCEVRAQTCWKHPFQSRPSVESVKSVVRTTAVFRFSKATRTLPPRKHSQWGQC